jgi:hypothetical protein
LVVLLPGAAPAQLIPGQHYVAASSGATFSTSELLRNTAIYPIPQQGGQPDKYNPVVTDIKVDPGLLLGGRYAYAVSRRLALQVQGDFAVGVCAIRQLEIKPDAEPGDQPQYETTTMDAWISQYSASLSYFLGPWRRAHLFVTAGVGQHELNLRQKGEVDPDPVRDRMILAGLGLVLHATERLDVAVEVRDHMYNFRFDNQFVDPIRSREILYRRPDLLLTTGRAGDKFQNDLTLAMSFVVRPF